MSDTQPTEPLPPHREQPAPQPAPQPAQAPHAPAGAFVGEPFYKRHGLAFAISTLVLSIVVLLGLVSVGTFAVANVVSHVGERAISRSMPHPGQPGVPGMPGRPGDGDDGGTGNGGTGNGGQDGTREGALVRGTIAAISGDTWTVDRQNGTPVTVKVDASTVYGMPGQSSSKSDFAKGDEVIVVGKRSGGTVTATRILKLDSFPTRPPSTPGSSTSGPQTPGT